MVNGIVDAGPVEISIDPAPVDVPAGAELIETIDAKTGAPVELVVLRDDARVASALADQLAALGLFSSSATADLAILSGEVYRDGNDQVRIAGGCRAIVADRHAAAAQVAGLQVEASGTPRHRGFGAYKW